MLSVNKHTSTTGNQIVVNKVKYVTSMTPFPRVGEHLQCSKTVPPRIRCGLCKQLYSYQKDILEFLIAVSRSIEVFACAGYLVCVTRARRVSK